MTPEEVYQYFGSAYTAAKAIGVTKQAIAKWLKKRFIPFNRQIEIQKITKGDLIAQEGDAKKPLNNDVITCTHLPNFRYYDKKHGMCQVESIRFRKGKAPKITYISEKDNRKKFTSFGMENLMHASDLVDANGLTVFEGDILQFEKNGKKGDNFTFGSIGQSAQLKKRKKGKFKIIGNIFE